MGKKSKTIGEQIKGVRKSLGLTQEALGLVINKSRETISAYEKNRIMPGADTFLRIMALQQK